MVAREAGRRNALVMGLVGSAVGFLLAILLLVDPLGLHSLDEHLRPEHEHELSREDGGLWTCGMHPHVIQEEPGQCPICHMDLVPMEVGSEVAMGTPGGTDPGGGDLEEEVLFYRSPMDPSITSPVPTQDSMGMDYVPVYADRAPDSGGVVVEIDPGGRAEHERSHREGGAAGSDLSDSHGGVSRVRPAAHGQRNSQE